MALALIALKIYCNSHTKESLMNFASINLRMNAQRIVLVVLKMPDVSKMIHNFVLKRSKQINLVFLIFNANLRNAWKDNAGGRIRWSRNLSIREYRIIIEQEKREGCLTVKCKLLILHWCIHIARVEKYIAINIKLFIKILHILALQLVLHTHIPIMECSLLHIMMSTQN